MPFADAGGVRLYAESTGEGVPIVFVHEFAGDFRNWEPQVRFLSRSHRCITFNARGYPPSDVPEDESQYSQSHAVEDIASVMRHFGVARAHIVGLSMGGYATLNFGIARPEMALSLTIVGAGHGSDPDKRAEFLEGSTRMADALLARGMQEAMADYMKGPTRRRFAQKDSRGAAEFDRQIGEHSALGSALTTRGCQLRRPTIYELKDGMRRITAPALVIAGDDDDPCLEPALFMKRNIPDARLWIAPRTTHTVNLEEPDAFNRVVADFLADVDRKGH
ncbi:MAG TPA: alpha/beta hydrolase [Ramlibacter sp.]|nr:alpha/beta hydrolase [Ramlibacter sp.]